jgi:hypothetical protein
LRDTTEAKDSKGAVTKLKPVITSGPSEAKIEAEN